MKKLLLVLLALFVAWPALASGSRTGFGMFLIIGASALLFLNRSRLTLILVAVSLSLAAFVFVGSDELIDKAIEISPTIERVVNFESGSGFNSFSARMRLGQRTYEIFSGDTYQWQGWRLPIFGGGFYAVPQGSAYNYRVGFGFHNGYVFPYEQAGWLGVLLSAIFLFRTVKYVRKSLRFKDDADRQFAVGVWCVLIAYIPALWVGQIFWHGFGTENMNSFLILLVVLAIKPSTPKYPLPQANPQSYR
ncbi:MAG: O-antigen ligase family protein [Mariniblastus sp.]|nr:O-antigen ligase family protein [Mariniblastus sp.]